MQQMIGQTPRTPEPEPASCDDARTAPESAPREVGGRKGPEPTRYGDWEKNCRCIDF